MEVKTRVSNFENFLNLVKGEGQNLEGDMTTIADETVIQATEKGLKAITANDGMTVVSQIRYKLDEESDEVVEEGEMPIGSIENLMDYLNRFSPSDVITVKLDDLGSKGSRIVLERDNPKKTAKVNTVHKDEVESAVPEDHPVLTEKFIFDKEENVYSIQAGDFDIDHKLKVKFDSDEMAEMLDDGRLVGERVVPIEIGRNSIKVSVGDERIGGFESRIDAKVKVEDEELLEEEFTFGEGLENIYPQVDGEVVLYLANSELPAWVTAQTDKYRADYINAPVNE